MKAIENLTNHLLIATSKVDGSFFEGAVVYICSHDSDLTFGLILNQPMMEIPLSVLLDKLEIPAVRFPENDAVLAGGPVETEQGFVLHTDDYHSDDTATIAPGIAMTASRDILSAIAGGTGPKQYHVHLGYSGWSPHQLEQEIAANDWLVVAADKNLVFDTPATDRYTAAVTKLGLSAATFNGEPGIA